MELCIGHLWWSLFYLVIILYTIFWCNYVCKTVYLFLYLSCCCLKCNLSCFFPLCTFYMVYLTGNGGWLFTIALHECVGNVVRWLADQVRSSLFWFLLHMCCGSAPRAACCCVLQARRRVSALAWLLRSDWTWRVETGTVSKRHWWASRAYLPSRCGWVVRGRPEPEKDDSA